MQSEYTSALHESKSSWTVSCNSVMCLYIQIFIISIAKSTSVASYDKGDRQKKRNLIVWVQSDLFLFKLIQNERSNFLSSCNFVNGYASDHSHGYDVV